MPGLTMKQLREAVAKLRAHQIPPLPCGCIPYADGITLTCDAHTVPLTDEQIAQSKKNLERFGIKL